MELTIHQEILLYGFLLALVLGALVNKTNFCTMGAVSDWVNMGDTGRLRSWLFAIAIATGGVIIMESAGLMDLDAMEASNLRPPYRMPAFDWLRFVLGGFMFGIGMTLASGCANKTLIRVGGGNLKSVVVLVIASYFAYKMAKTDFYGDYFYSWMNPLAIDLRTYGIGGQDIGRIIAGITGYEDAITIRAVIGGIFVLGILAFVFKSADFRKNFDNILGGAVVGICVVVAWGITSGSKGQEWLEATTFMDTPPRGVGAQSFTFTSPMADSFDYVLNMGKTLSRSSTAAPASAENASPAENASEPMEENANQMDDPGSSMDEPSASAEASGSSVTTALANTNRTFATFGVMLLVGAILGSFLYAVIFRKFRIEWFHSWKDFIAHSIGAVLMGIGGVLSLGCTIGQGITGFSNLAVGSFITFVFIVFGSALTMKIQYYKMVYESEASFAGAFITALVDMKLLPGSMRKLEAV